MRKSTGALLLFGAGPDALDILYATGFAAPDAVVYLRLGTQAYLVVSPLEYGRAWRSVRAAQVISSASLRPAGSRRFDPAEWAIALLRRTRRRVVQVSSSFPLSLARRLEHAGLRVTVQPGAVFPERARKGAAELRNMRATQRAAVAAMQTARNSLARAAVDSAGRLARDGRPLYAEHVRYEVERCLHDHGCTADLTLVACGPQAANPHEAGSGMLLAGVPIVVDIFPRHRRHGYWGDLTRTYIRGVPRPGWVQALNAVLAAQRAALNLLAPGTPLRNVHAAAEDILAQQGFATHLDAAPPSGFIHSTGHGIGLAVHEEPRLAAVPGRLAAGHVVTVEPGLYFPGRGGIRIEDTVVITDAGWKYLCPCPKQPKDLML